MHYYLYEIRNNINGKIYVGVHKTKVLDDGYMGSGKIISRAIEKYGVENFTKTILETFESQEEMFAREKEVVSEEFLSREDTYNLRRGGNGGWDYLNKTGKNNPEESREVRNKNVSKGVLKAMELNPDLLEMYRNNFLLGLQKSIDTRKINYPNGTFFGKQHSEETKEKMSEAARGKHEGEKNSQYGSMWITNGTENKKMKKAETIPDGWYKGRKIKTI
jgi:hypothetical protein